MFFHPSFVLFLFFLILSMVMMVCMNSWFLVWFFIEMNLLCFIPLIMGKKSKYSVESGLKYFFVQTLSSILIMVGVLLLFMNFSGYTYFFMGGLSIKLGFAPFHQWMVNIVEGLTWLLVGILFTLQKVGPFILFNYVYIMEEKVVYLIYLISIMCAVVGSLGGLFTSSLRKIMAFSSIAHGSWMILGMLVSIYLWLMYFTFYSLILFSVLYILGNFELANLSQIFLKLNFGLRLSLGVNLLSMGGLPPMSGFIPKFILMKEFIMFYNYFVLFILLFGVFVSLFFYARVFVMNFIFLSPKNLLFSENKVSVGPGFYINLLGLVTVPLILYLY
uniref:NADH-ubiquinone oxidoreductase chain 2 n=1 Tax=Metacrangonyx sp. n. DJ2019 TaxID=2606684 RepID=A0A5C0Q1A4_9CRUS|nr:NADH dehydrogenase subunit 2 [Metacrangonyx sp. n. DJ2019]